MSHNTRAHKLSRSIWICSNCWLSWEVAINCYITSFLWWLTEIRKMASFLKLPSYKYFKSAFMRCIINNKYVWQDIEFILIKPLKVVSFHLYANRFSKTNKTFSNRIWPQFCYSQTGQFTANFQPYSHLTSRFLYKGNTISAVRGKICTIFFFFCSFHFELLKWYFFGIFRSDEPWIELFNLNW